MQDPGGWFRTYVAGRDFVVAPTGRWDLSTAAALDAALGGVDVPLEGADVKIDLKDVSNLDSAGALVVLRLRERLGAAARSVEVVNAPSSAATLLRAVDTAQAPAPAAPSELPPLLRIVAEVGEAVIEFGQEARRLVGFFGLVVLTAGPALARPARLRLAPFVHHLEHTGIRALGIIGLLSFLIGVVLAFQGAIQLRQFGAELFVVDLLAIGVLREVGVLLTAIVVAGRSGSAFTAQIGTMVVNQEVDAMRAIGLDPVARLVLPRIAALALALPLLTFFADIVALVGGAVTASWMLDIGPETFLAQLRLAVGVDQFLVGMVKAPVFAFAIALVGCYAGLRVSGSAESVGRMTTRSVVQSIFLVIVLDAIFSVAFAILDV